MPGCGSWRRRATSPCCGASPRPSAARPERPCCCSPEGGGRGWCAGGGKGSKVLPALRRTLPGDCSSKPGLPTPPHPVSQAPSRPAKPSPVQPSPAQPSPAQPSQAKSAQPRTPRSITHRRAPPRPATTYSPPALPRRPSAVALHLAQYFESIRSNKH